MEDGEAQEGGGMNKIIEIIKNKPAWHAWGALIYIVLVGLVKWGLQPPVGAVLFLAGGALGIYFLDLAEAFFKLTPSPFRTVQFFLVYAVASFFIVTSSGSLLAIGLVLSMYLSLLLTIRKEKWVMVGLGLIFFIETLFFLR